MRIPGFLFSVGPQNLGQTKNSHSIDKKNLVNHHQYLQLVEVPNESMKVSQNYASFTKIVKKLIFSMCPTIFDCILRLMLRNSHRTGTGIESENTLPQILSQ